MKTKHSEMISKLCKSCEEIRASLVMGWFTTQLCPTVRRNGKATWCGNSTMHTLSKRTPTHDDYEIGSGSGLKTTVEFERFWRFAAGDSSTLKMSLSEGFLQRRMVYTNDKVLRNIIMQRTGYRFCWWKFFIDAVLAQAAHPEFLIKQGEPT